MTIVIRYNEEYIVIKNFIFKIAMEFSSLKQFKDEVLKHNVLNVRAKNDDRRCMVVLRHKNICDYNVLCSRVVRTISFIVKTWFLTHKYGRVFLNKKAKASCVAKVIVKKLKNNTKTKLT